MPLTHWNRAASCSGILLQVLVVDQKLKSGLLSMRNYDTSLLCAYADFSTYIFYVTIHETTVICCIIKVGCFVSLCFWSLWAKHLHLKSIYDWIKRREKVLRLVLICVFAQINLFNLSWMSGEGVEPQADEDGSSLHPTGWKRSRVVTV